MKKVCKICKIEFELNSEYYHKDKYTKDWFKTKCKNCSNSIFREWRKNNKELANSISLSCYWKNPKKWRDYSNEYKVKNKDRVIEYKKIYDLEYYTRELVRLRTRINWHKRRLKIKEWNDWTIDIKSVLLLLEKQNYRCPICWISLENLQNIMRTWRISDWKHLDHIIPLCKWWFHSINNVQWLCYKCNLSKQDKIL